MTRAGWHRRDVLEAEAFDARRVAEALTSRPGEGPAPPWRALALGVAVAVLLAAGTAVAVVLA